MSNFMQVIQVKTLVDSNGIETIRLDDANTHVHRRKGPTPRTSRDAGESTAVSHTAIEMRPDEDQSMMAEGKEGRSGNIFLVSGEMQQKQNQLAENIETVDQAGQSGHVAIQIEGDQEDERKTPVAIFRSFLLLMYWLGLSTYDPRCDQNNSPKTRCSVLFKIIFWTFVVSGLTHSLIETKYNILWFIADAGMTNFVDVGFCIVPILAEISIARLLAFQHGEIKWMLSCLGKVCELTNDVYKGRNHKFIWRIMKLMMATSILMTAIETSSEVPLIGWSIDKVILAQSESMGKGLFMWKPRDVFDASNVSVGIIKRYGSEVSGFTVTMAFVSGFMNFSSSLKLEIIIDLVIAAGWCLKECIRMHAKKVQSIDFRTYTNGNDADELNSATGDWAKYQKLKAANKAMNVVFDGILKLIHIQNTMICAYFLMHLIQNDLSALELLLLVYSIAKMAVAYYIAKQSHGYNAVFQQWIRVWAMQSHDPKFHWRVTAMLDEMKAEPLGLGSGEFIIGESFILKFVGMVGSLFVLQVDNAEPLP